MTSVRRTRVPYQQRDFVVITMRAVDIVLPVQCRWVSVFYHGQVTVGHSLFYSRYVLFVFCCCFLYIIFSISDRSLTVLQRIGL